MPTIKLLKRQRDSVPTNRKREYQAVYQDKRWKKLRGLKLRANPLCERCESMRRVTPAVEVHHRKPFDKGRTAGEIEELAYDYDNLESLCQPCHEARHKDIRD